MPEEKTTISIIKNTGTPTQETIDIKTNGFLLFYLFNDKIKTEGDIELRALTPILMKLAMEKFTGSK